MGRKSNLSRELASVNTAILREDELRLQFVLDGAEYEVALKKGRDGVFRGRWERGRPGAVEQSGEANCSLSELPESESPGGQALLLQGRWFEDIDWHWAGRLEFVAQ